MAQLADAIAHINARELDQNEGALASCFPPPPAMSEEAKQRVVPFLAWCEAQRVRALPAKPTSVAAFICWQQDQRIPRPIIIETLAAIEALHNAASLGNPVAAPIITATMGTTVEPPRSWKQQDKAFFKTLPLHAQETIATRERHREVELRRMQNELAELRKTGGAAKAADNTTEGIDTMAKKEGHEKGAGPFSKNDVKLTHEPVPPFSMGKDISKKVMSNGDRTGGMAAKLDNE